MRWLRAAVGAIAAAALLGACAASVTPEPSALAPSTTATPTAGASTASPSEPAASPTPEARLPEAGLPYDGSEILDAMHSSRRPGGVPDALETPAVAEAVAELLWTIDGTAWDTMAAGGSCTSETSCRLELAGSGAGRLGEDVWVFTIDPTTAAAEVTETTLGSVPRSVADALDVAARGLTSLDDLRLTSVRWTPPPHSERFQLSYRDAGEEGGCAVELVLDAVAGALIEEDRTGC